MVWALKGDFVVGLTGRARLVFAARYESSPVGPYLELAVAEPARLGARPGIHVTTMAVDSAASCEEGRRRWGFPKEVTGLHWESDDGGGELLLRWEEGEVEVRATPLGPVVPVVVPGWAIQTRGEDPVVVPLRLRGRARPARVRIVAPPGSRLAGLDGGRPGAVLLDSTLVVGPARRS